MSEGRKPDYRVAVSKRDVKGSTTVGAAWNNKAGGINIKLNPGLSVVLSERSDITLWPPKDYVGSQSAPPADPLADAFGSDDVPF